MISFYDRSSHEHPEIPRSVLDILPFILQVNGKMSETLLESMCGRNILVSPSWSPQSKLGFLKYWSVAVMLRSLCISGSLRFCVAIVFRYQLLLYPLWPPRGRNYSPQRGETHKKTEQKISCHVKRLYSATFLSLSVVVLSSGFEISKIKMEWIHICIEFSREPYS